MQSTPTLTPIEYLEHQHRHLLEQIENLEKFKTQIERGAPVDYKAFRDEIIYLDRELHFHKRVEEQTIYPLLAVLTGEDGPASFVVLEHRRMWNMMNQLREWAEQTTNNTFNAHLSETLSAFINILRLHIEKENKILFPQVKRLLNRPDSQQIINAFHIRFAEQLNG